MLIDHIFISSKTQGHEAKLLVDSEFLEGSSRIHPGQGTRNRKFYFENFFLEILWENDPKELESELIRNAGLKDRVRFGESGYSRFGLGLENTGESDLIFRDAERYQPVYFPAGMDFEFLSSSSYPLLPWTFRGPFIGPKTAYDEPTAHPNEIRFLTRAIFQMPEENLNSDLVDQLRYHPQLKFEASEKVALVLEFDGGIQGKELDFPELDLTIRF